MKFEKIFEMEPLVSFIKYYAKHLTKKCSNCNKKRIDLLFDAYISQKLDLCLSCRIDLLIIKGLLHLILAGSLSKKNIKHLLRKPLYRRSITSVVDGIAKFGIRRPQPTGVPVVVVWNITSRCNLRCIHCWEDASPVPADRELNTDEALKVVDKLNEAGVAVLGFAGGEPLLRSDFFEIAEYAKKNDIYCTLATNGTLITEKIAKKIVDVGISGVEIGLNAAAAKTHDSFCQVPGSFKRTVEGIKNCAKTRGFPPICINTTLTKHTYYEIPKILKLAQNLGASRYYVSRVLPVGRGKDINVDVTPKKKKKVLEFLYDHFHEGKMQCLARGMTYFARVCYENSKGVLFPVNEILTGYEEQHTDIFGTDFATLVREFSQWFGGCSAGLTYCGISPEGDVLPCAPSSVKLGNLMEKSLEDIWNKNHVLDQLRDRKRIKGTCGRCEFNSICGGCRVTAYGVTGDWMEADPSCPFAVD